MDLDLTPVVSPDLRTAVALTLLTGILLYVFRKKRTPPLPPGPRGLPFVGNVLDVPASNYWLKFAELGDVWGDIFSLTVFGQTMVIINSVEVAEDLLDVQGATFSDRPVIPMAGELAGFNNVVSLCQYGDRVKQERKLFYKTFGTLASIKKFAPLISSEVMRFLNNIAVEHSPVFSLIGRLTGSITLRIAYGYQTLDGLEEDPYIHMFQTAGENFTSSTKPVAYLVDIWPALRYWPAWLPGGKFRTTARAMSKQVHDTIDRGINFVKVQMVEGTAEPSFASTFLEAKNHDDYLVKWAAASVQVGGSDTTAAQLEAFFLAMMLYPEVQAAAQKEIDAVVGPDRLPDLSDRQQLKYVDALCKEVFRWHVAAPTAVPHRTRKDFIYNHEGKVFYIPENAMVIPNIWKMTHDPKQYKNPSVFDPTRFIPTEAKDAERDPTTICFGYGRRICPGKLLAESTIFLACSAVLAVFNIRNAQKNGVIQDLQLTVTSGTVSHPVPFECEVQPRSERALELMHAS